MENQLRRIVDAIRAFVWAAAPDGSVASSISAGVQRSDLSLDEDV